MQSQRHLQFYEHDCIRIGESRNGCVFTEKDWNLLLQLNETQYPPYLQAIHRGIRTLNYVGLIQIPGLCVEILPKTDRNKISQNRQILLELLFRSKKIPAFSLNNHLDSTAGSLNDYFLTQFLEEVEKLCRKGLVKQYRRESVNSCKFRGRMQFREQVRRNYAHKERIYAEHQVFDSQHQLNNLLRRALNEVPNLCRDCEMLQRSRQLLDNFPQEGNPGQLKEERKEIKYSRLDIHYKPAIEWAQFILNKIAPQAKPGSLKCSAFLFDMQQLFEEVVAQEIGTAASQMGCSLQLQPSRHFWGQRKIRPDMVLKTAMGENIILDTKWKLLKHSQPDEADLKQMYIYNRFFRAKRGLLIYPRQPGQLTQGARFCEQEHNPLRCDLLFVNLMDDKNGKFNARIGAEILEQILFVDQQTN